MVDVSVLQTGLATPAWEEEQAAGLAGRLQGVTGDLTLLGVVETLGPVLTSTTVEVRRAGLSLVSSTLALLPPALLPAEELAVLTAFYTDRLRDHHSLLPASLRGLRSLASSRHLSAASLEQLLDRMFREVMVQQQVVADRTIVYSLLAGLLANRLTDLRPLATMFTVGLLQASEGEKDPRNLLVVFASLAGMLDSLDLAHLREDVFEALAVYFPVDFAPARGAPAGGVTKAQLVSGLRSGLAHPGLAQWTLGLLLEKLDSDLEAAKLDSLATLQAVAARSGPAELEHWAREVEGVWAALHRETMGIRLQPSPEVQAEARAAVRAVSACLARGAGAGALSTAWDRWLGRAWAACSPHLRSPATRLCAAAGEVLGEVARAGPVPGRAVLARALPELLAAWDGLEGGAEARAALLQVTGELLVAAGEGVQGEVGEEGELDRVVALLLSAVAAGGKEGVGAGHRLGRAAVLLSAAQRREVARALVAGVAEHGEEGLGAGMAELARTDPELVRGEVVPGLLALGRRGLGAASRLWGAGLYWDTVPGLVAAMVGGELGEQGAAELVALLAHHGPPGGQAGGAAPLLLELLRWPGRPGGPAMERVLGDLGELLGPGDCREVGDLLAGRGLLEPGAGPVLLSASPAVLAAWGPLVAGAMAGEDTEAVWRVRAALINRCPGLAPALGTAPPEAVDWVAAGLVRRGDGSAAPWLEALVGQVAAGRPGAPEAVGRLLGPCWWRHAATGLLFKQRAWTQLHPALTAAGAGPGHTAALVLLLPSLPRPLLEPHLAALLPRVVAALAGPATALHALNCLADFVKLDVALVASHLQEVADGCLALATEGDLATRTRALQVLANCGAVEGPDRVRLAPMVTQRLGAAVRDRKRVVRTEAARARNTWFLVTQAVGEA